jgi:hypothetical protein
LYVKHGEGKMEEGNVKGNGKGKWAGMKGERDGEQESGTRKEEGV